MTSTTKTTVKSYFESGDRPTQGNFTDLIDSCLFLAESSSQTIENDIVVSGQTTLRGPVVVSGFVSAHGGGLLKGAFTLASPTVNTPTINTPNVSAGTFNSPTINTPTVSAGTFASPSLTGTPATVSAAKNTNTNQIANTNFVLNQAASASVMEAGTSITEFVTPGLQQRHPSAAKFWVKISANGTNQASHNVASVVRNSQGNYTITYNNGFSTANYSGYVTPLDPVVPLIGQWLSQAASSCVVQVLTVTGSTSDPSAVCVGGFGDL